MRKSYDDVFLDHLEALTHDVGFEAFMRWVSDQREDLCRRLEQSMEMADTAMTRGEVRALRRVEQGLAQLIQQRKTDLEQPAQLRKGSR